MLTLVLAPPWVALSTLLLIVVVLEANPDGFLAAGSHFYSTGGKVGLPFMLFLLVVAATLFELVAAASVSERLVRSRIRCCSCSARRSSGL